MLLFIVFIAFLVFLVGFFLALHFVERPLSALIWGAIWGGGGLRRWCFGRFSGILKVWD